MFSLLEGKLVNLRVAEKEDVPFLADWWNNPDFAEYFSPTQGTRAGMEKFLESTFLETKHFIIEKKDGSKIGWIMHFNFLCVFSWRLLPMRWLGFAPLPRTG